MTLHCESEKEFQAILKVKVLEGVALTTDRFLTLKDGANRIAVFAPEQEGEESGPEVWAHTEILGESNA